MSNANELAAELAADHPKTDSGMVENHVRKVTGETPVHQPAPEVKPVDDGLIRDKAGEIFDPKKHRANEWGRPELTEGGYFKRLPLQERLAEAVRDKAERVKSAITGEPSEPEPATPPPAPEPALEQASESFGLPEGFDFPKPGDVSEASEAAEPSRQVKSQAQAKAVALFVTVSAAGQALGGVSCKPLPEHKAAMVEAYEAFFLENPDWKMPAWMGCALATGTYGLFCYQQKTFRERTEPLLKKAFRTIGGWIGKLRGSIAARRIGGQ